MAAPETPPWLAPAEEIECQVLHPGFVIIRNALGEAAQLELCELAFQRGDRLGPEGWWVSESDVAANYKAGSWDKGQVGAQGQEPDQRRQLNVARKKAGKVYDALGTFPGGDRLGRLAVELAKVAASADPHLATVPVAAPSHLLLWNYRPAKGQRIGWHRDNWRGDGDADHPVISISVGASCNFGWRPQPVAPCAMADTAPGTATATTPSVNQSVILASGDVVIFGGVSRM